MDHGKRLGLGAAVAIVVAALALTLLGAGVAVADTPIIGGSIEDDGQDYVGRIIVITDPRPSSATFCGDIFHIWKAVIINPGGGPALVTTVGISPSHDTRAGDRFDIVTQSECDESLELILVHK